MNQSATENRSPCLRLVAPLSAKKGKASAKRFTPTTAALAVDCVYVDVREQGELLARTREKYQGATNYPARHYAHFKMAGEIRKELLHLYDSGHLDPAKASELVKKLHSALLSIVTRPPEGSWFERESDRLRIAMTTLEKTALEQLGLELGFVSYLHRPERRRVSRNSHLALVR